MDSPANSDCEDDDDDDDDDDGMDDQDDEEGGNGHHDDDRVHEGDDIDRDPLMTPSGLLSVATMNTTPSSTPGTAAEKMITEEDVNARRESMRSTQPRRPRFARPSWSSTMPPYPPPTAPRR